MAEIQFMKTKEKKGYTKILNVLRSHLHGPFRFEAQKSPRFWVFLQKCHTKMGEKKQAKDALREGIEQLRGFNLYTAQLEKALSDLSNQEAFLVPPAKFKRAHFALDCSISPVQKNTISSRRDSTDSLESMKECLSQFDSLSEESSDKFVAQVLLNKPFNRTPTAPPNPELNLKGQGCHFSPSVHRRKRMYKCR